MWFVFFRPYHVKEEFFNVTDHDPEIIGNHFWQGNHKEDTWYLNQELLQTNFDKDAMRKTNINHFNSKIQNITDLWRSICNIMSIGPQHYLAKYLTLPSYMNHGITWTRLSKDKRGVKSKKKKKVPCIFFLNVPHKNKKKMYHIIFF